MFPPNLEHSNSTGRLDLFALFGPTVHYHSVDSCFCNSCIKIAKKQLTNSIEMKKFEEMTKMGTSGMPAIEKEKPITMRGGQKTVSTTRKLMEAPRRLLHEEDINSIIDDLCEKCQKHCDGFVHLTCGRGA